MIYRAQPDAEYLEEYIKDKKQLTNWDRKWGYYQEPGPWGRTYFYVFCAGTGKGSCFEEITEAEAFIEIL